jgi:hypothetical protein
MNIGKKIPPPAPPAQPKYKPHPTNKSIVINTETGQWETRQPLPPGPSLMP